MENLRCNSCGGNGENLSLGHFVFRDKIVCVCWNCFRNVFGSKEVFVVTPQDKAQADMEISGLSKERDDIILKAIGINPCDTLTRQHLAEIENEKLFTGKYTPPLIPGCPADKKRKEVE